MKLEEFFDSRGYGIDKGVFGKPVEYAHEIEHGRMTNDVQWMVLPERSSAVYFTANVKRPPRGRRVVHLRRTGSDDRAGWGFWRRIVHADATDYGDSPAGKSNENILFS